MRQTPLAVAENGRAPSAPRMILDALAFVTEDSIFDGTDAYIVVKNGTGGVKTIAVSS